jgi:hypothetical protein
MIMLNKKATVLLLIVLGLGQTASVSAQTEPSFQFTEASLGKLLKMPDLSARLASPDNRRFAYIASVAGKAVVVTDGKQGPQYDSIVKRTLSFSPDSRHVAYIATHKVGYPAFSPDSKHLAYLAREANAWRMVIGEAKSAAYESVLNRESVRFDDSGAVYFIAIRKGEAFRIKCSMP